MEREKRIEATTFFRLITVAFLGLGFLQFADFVSGDSAGQTFARLGLYATAVGCIPLVYKVWPSPRVESISATRWIWAIALFFVALVITNFSSPVQHSFLDNYPRLKDTLNSWVLPVFLAALCLSLVFLRRKPLRSSSVRSKTGAFKLVLWVAIVLVGVLLPFAMSPSHPRLEATLMRISSTIFSSGGAWIRPTLLLSAGVVLMLFGRGGQGMKRN